MAGKTKNEARPDTDRWVAILGQDAKARHEAVKRRLWHLFHRARAGRGAAAVCCVCCDFEMSTTEALEGYSYTDWHPVAESELGLMCDACAEGPAQDHHERLENERMGYYDRRGC